MGREEDGLVDGGSVLFMKPSKPQEQKDFPFSEHDVKNGKQRKRKLMMRCHLDKFPWLSVSRVPGLEGAFCTPCVLFCRGEGVGRRGDGRGQKVGVLVTKPLCRFDDLTGKEGILSAHENKLYNSTMHSLSLQWKSSESEPLQAKDRTTPVALKISWTCWQCGTYIIYLTFFRFLPPKHPK